MAPENANANMMVTDGKAGQAAAEDPETGQGIEKAHRGTDRALRTVDSGIATMIEIGEPEEIAGGGMARGAMTTATGKKGEAMEIVHTEEVRALVSQQLSTSNH